MENEYDGDTEFWFVCRHCGYRILPIEYYNVRYDYVCPRCYKGRLSDFGIDAKSHGG